MTPPKKRRLGKRRMLLLVLLVILAAVAGGFFAMRQALNSPAVGNVVTTLPQSTRQATIELEQFDGANFSFVHPMTYIKQTTKQQPLPNEIESHTFMSSGVVSKMLIISLTKFPSGKLDDDASYYMRTQNPSRYKMRTIVVKNETVATFTDSSDQQYQQTAFWTHGGKLLTFTLSGVAADTPSMTREFNDMVQSIGWR